LKWLKNFWGVLKEAGNDFIDDHCTKLSASLAYYTIFSIGPLLLVVITLVGIFYKKTSATTEVMDTVSQFAGKEVAAQLESVLTHISLQTNTTLFGVIGAVVFVFGATGVFIEIQSSINYIWSIRAKPKSLGLHYLTNRLLSFLFVIGLGLTLICTLALNLLLDLVMDRIYRFKHLQKFLGDSDIEVIKYVNFGVLFVVVTILFSIIYKVLPDAKIYWKDTLVGSAFTALLFLAGKYLISFYLSSSSMISSYGAAASLIILLSWVYYSAIILYFGAQFTKVYAMKWGRGITVYDSAVYIIKREAKELPALKHPIPEN
jgi:membrane protein